MLSSITSHTTASATISIRRKQKNGFLLTLTYKFHFAAAVYEQYLCICLKLAERLRQRQSWLKFYKKLLDFSFLKGLAVATGSVEELQKLILASKSHQATQSHLWFLI
jgi:hypothetical protein